MEGYRQKQYGVLTKRNYKTMLQIQPQSLSAWAGPFFIVFAKYTLFRLKTQTVFAGRLAEVLGAVAAEMGER